MKKIILFFTAAVVLASCGDMKLKSDGKYGENFTTDSVMTVAALTTLMQTTNEAQVVVEGTVNGVCKSEGCWLTLENKSGEELFIEIKDKAFHLPFNVEGKHAIVKGVVTKSQISVAELQAEAKEEGKSEAEIQAITAPKEEITMETTGLILQ